MVPAEVATEAPVAAVSAESDEGYAAPAEAVTEAPVAEEYAPAEVGYFIERKLLVRCGGVFYGHDSVYYERANK